MFFKISEYIKYLLKSKNQHGIHSPFVYDFITKCLYLSSKNKSAVLDYKQDLLKNNNQIVVRDLGAGSKIFNSNNRKISDIAKHAGISNKYALLLNRFISYFEIKTILEIGTSLGIAAYSMKIDNSNTTIETIEGCTETAKIAQHYFNKYQLKNINLITADFDKSLNTIVKNKQYDFIYFDGNHQKTATLNYFKTCLKTIHNNSIFIFDDIHWSKEMNETWEIIKKDTNVTVTIDLYQWGIVFFRKELTKQDFIIRF